MVKQYNLLSPGAEGLTSTQRENETENSSLVSDKVTDSLAVHN